jgi:HD-GYP domain-containing protein (c-di-GMP phosphodiesterase class II)
LDFLHSLAGQAAISIDNNRLYSGLQRANVDLLLAYDTTIEGWSHALDMRDEETEGHALRVTELTFKLTSTARFSEEELAHIQNLSGSHFDPKVVNLFTELLAEEEHS